MKEKFWILSKIVCQDISKQHTTIIYNICNTKFGESYYNDEVNTR